MIIPLAVAFTVWGCHPLFALTYSIRFIQINICLVEPQDRPWLQLKTKTQYQIVISSGFYHPDGVDMRVS